MYRRPKFLEILDEVRQEMSREADYDVDLFAELIRQGKEERQIPANKREETVTFEYSPQEILSPKMKK
jgi:hypothetical protein